MADDGYLVGFEDSNGNFVEVGRFNNTAENVSDPLIIQHTDSGETMELGSDGFTTGEINTKKLGSSTIFAGDYSGSDPDARLDSALSDANNNDEIILENSDYDSARTISTKLLFKGTEIDFDVATARIRANWTLNSSCAFQSIRFDQPVTVSGNGGTQFRFCTIGDVDVNSSRVRVVGCNGTGTVTFASGTNGGIVDSSTGVAVTDNGSNTVGDIA